MSEPDVPLATQLVAFANALRHHGVSVGTSDVIDAGKIVTTLGLSHRERLRAGLAAAYLRRGDERQVFDQLFDLYFPAAVGERQTVQPREGTAPDAGRPDATALRERARELTEEFAHALAADDSAALTRLAAVVVGEFGVVRRAEENGYSAEQALEQFQPNLAIARAAELLTSGPESGGDDGGTGSGTRGTTSVGGGQGVDWFSADATGWQPEPFTQRFDRDIIRDRVAAFRRAVESETRRRNSTVRGVQQQATQAVRAPIERRDFALTYAVEAAELRQVIDPLAKKLAARMSAKRRRAAHGAVDVRKTLRTSLATGGVPLKPAYANRTPAKADLVMLCDMSSSVSGFSRFAILLMQAMHAQFGRVRVFGFINRIEELTPIVREVGRDGDLVEALRGNTRMTRGHRNSDYGTSFVEFATTHLDAVTPRATVLVLGDARTNNTDPEYDVLRLLAQRARHIHWLNPEPESQWGQGDSVADRYARIVTMHECRTITDLRHFVAREL